MQNQKKADPIKIHCRISPLKNGMTKLPCFLKNLASWGDFFDNGLLLYPASKLFCIGFSLFWRNWGKLNWIRILWGRATCPYSTYSSRTPQWSSGHRYYQFLMLTLMVVIDKIWCQWRYNEGRAWMSISYSMDPDTHTHPLVSLVIKYRICFPLGGVGFP